MPEVHIPNSLFEQIEQVIPAAASAEAFVVQAVREKLSWEGRKGEFYRLSDETRAAMTGRGLTEADILADFEKSRNGLGETDRA